jgi:hypothetical protein
MRTCIAILLFFIYSSAVAQTDIALGNAITQLNLALIDKDTVQLHNLLSEQLSYGHSNGWIETKQEVISDLYSGKLVYNKIDQRLAGITKEKNTACVRANAELDITYNGKPMHIKLHVLQVWIKKNKDWKLLSRQSTKID